MMSTTRSVISLLITCIFLSSCGENGALKEEYFYVDPQNEDWVPGLVGNHTFIVKDTNMISQSFIQRDESEYMGQGWSSFMGINYHMSFKEYRYHAYSASYGDKFSYSITAGSPPFGDELTIEVNDINFAYDLYFEKISRLYTEYGNASLGYYEDGLGKDEVILSTVTIYPTFKIDSLVYNEVLHFKLADFEESWNRYTVTDIYLAKGKGLIRYKLFGGIEYTRE